MAHQAAGRHLKRFITEMKSFKRVQLRGATNCRPSLSSSSSWRDKLLTDARDAYYSCGRLMGSQCDFLAVRYSSSVNFLATIWPLIEILRSLVVYVNHHNKDYLRKTPFDWLCGDDAAFVKLL